MDKCQSTTNYMWPSCSGADSCRYIQISQYFRTKTKILDPCHSSMTRLYSACSLLVFPCQRFWIVPGTFFSLFCVTRTLWTPTTLSFKLQPAKPHYDIMHSLNVKKLVFNRGIAWTINVNALFVSICQPSDELASCPGCTPPLTPMSTGIGSSPPRPSIG